MVKTTTTFFRLLTSNQPSITRLFRNILLLLCTLPMCVWSSQVARPIFQCTQNNGQLLFTDVGCAGQQSYVPPAEAVTEFIPLSEAELRRLQELSERRLKASKQRRLNLRKRQQALVRQAAAAVQACNRAKAELTTIAIQRRKGYSIKQSKQLSAARRKHQAAKKKYC